jgi:hypothetical protein
MPEPEITLVTESFNLDEGQSFEELRSALTTLGKYLKERQDCEGILVDTSNDPRVSPLIASIDPRIRHLRAPGLGYDQAKDKAAEAARGLYVVYLDGDCTPDRPDWLDTLLAPLRTGKVLATGGVTIYAGDSLLARVSSLIDFGFLFNSAGSKLTCYASNNVAFTRDLRCSVPPPDGPLRCHCFAHAQALLRRGTPVMLVPDALVWHELPPLMKERLRRGYDHVAAGWVDPALRPEQWLTHRISRLAKLYFRNLGHDWRRMRHAPAQLRLRGWRRIPAIGLAAWLRLIELRGAWQAIRETPARLESPATRPVEG